MLQDGISQGSPNTHDLYEMRLKNEMNQISTSVYNNGFKITKLESSAGLKILIVLIRYACQGQNIGPIMLARKQIKMIPQDWLHEYIPKAANDCINFDDEWEYRRLLELIDEAVPSLLKWAVEQGGNSLNEETREASQDFAI
jgi:hypothetical protein